MQKTVICHQRRNQKIEKLVKKKNKLVGINVKKLKKLSQLNLDPGSKPTIIMTMPNPISLAENS